MVKDLVAAPSVGQDGTSGQTNASVALISDPETDLGLPGTAGGIPESSFFSYMVGFNDGVGAPAQGEYFDWSGYGGFDPVIIGTDLRLNPADHHEVEVLTAGEYVISVDVSFRSDEDPTSGSVSLLLDGTFVNAGWGLHSADIQAVPVAPYGSLVHVPWTTPPVRLRANDTIKLLLMSVPNVGAVTPLVGQITVKRVA